MKYVNYVQGSNLQIICVLPQQFARIHFSKAHPVSVDNNKTN